MDIMLVLYGLKPIKRPNCARIGLKQRRLAVHDRTLTQRNCRKKTAVTLSGVVEFDELYLVAGHKGQPDKVKQAKRPARRRRLKGARGRGTLANEKPPIFGMIQRSGDVVIKMLDNRLTAKYS